LLLPAIWLILSNPAAPQKWFPLYFLAFLALGLAWFTWNASRRQST
jgi:hypothetical protein